MSPENAGLYTISKVITLEEVADIGSRYVDGSGTFVEIRFIETVI
ncbi:MAG: hypothetical protein WCK31_01910 [bacterium]